MSRSVLTFSSLSVFRNCPRKYKHRYLDHLRPVEKADAWHWCAFYDGPQISKEVYVHGVRTRIPKWQGWVRAARAKLDELMTEAA
jgi:hypothetical protein